MNKLLPYITNGSKIYPSKHRINDNQMPAYYDYRWNNFNISVRPTDFRRFKLLRNFPFLCHYLSGSNIKLGMTVDDLSGEKRTISYNWSLGSIINGEYRFADGERYFRCETGPGCSVIYDRRLHEDGKHILQMQFGADEDASEEIVMAEFTIFDRDTAMLKRSRIVLYVVFSGIIALLIKLFLG